ncbi:DUF7662 domain-containing protein [Domibacillus tundrae]|uniref:DUF7662 domain-containing protein n=1 Tax=Domibacillus tundrae TaxID=1587527 RepID=UPI000695B189|nr:hypothetical protein [Domibacillus tundrae]
MSRISKYYPLSQYLQQQDRNSTAAVKLSFKDIEHIIQTSLPPTARKRVQWWANSKTEQSRQCSSWIGYNWETAQVDINNESVVFRKK